MDKFFIEKAKIELREDESRKSQSLAHFKDWIGKHPFLSRVEYEDNYLLMYLRATKYNMDKAFSLFENFYLASKLCPKFFNMTSDEFDRMEALYRSGSYVPLKGRSKDGQKIVIVRYGQADPDRFHPRDFLRLATDSAISLLSEEETQISGIIFITDGANSQLKHLMLPTDFMEFMIFFKKAVAFRQKGYYIVNQPSFANFIAELFKSVLSEKLQKRLFVLKSSEDLKNYVDVDLLPKEYGGSVPIQEMLDEFLEFRSKQKFSLRKILDADVDWAKVPKDRMGNDGDESVGSFRKLEID